MTAGAKILCPVYRSVFFTYKLGNSKKLTGLEKRRFLQEGALDRNIFARLTLREFERERAPPILLRTALSFFRFMQSPILLYGATLFPLEQSGGGMCVAGVGLWGRARMCNQQKRKKPPGRGSFCQRELTLVYEPKPFQVLQIYEITEGNATSFKAVGGPFGGSDCNYGEPGLWAGKETLFMERSGVKCVCGGSEYLQALPTNFCVRGSRITDYM